MRRKRDRNFGIRWLRDLLCGVLIGAGAILPGMVLTILLLARLVSWFFRKHYSIAFHGIFGIVLAATLVIIPTSYVGAWEIVLSAVCCIGGFLLAYFMARLDRRIQENGRA